MRSTEQPQTQPLVSGPLAKHHPSRQDIEDALNAAFRKVLWRDDAQDQQRKGA